jgi:hypothetical protein
VALDRKALEENILRQERPQVEIRISEPFVAKVLRPFDRCYLRVIDDALEACFAHDFWMTSIEAWPSQEGTVSARRFTTRGT